MPGKRKEETSASMKGMKSSSQEGRLGAAQGSCKHVGGDERRHVGRSSAAASAVSKRMHDLCYSRDFGEGGP